MQAAYVATKRILWALPVLLAVSFATYALLFQVGDPARVAAGELATEEQIELTRQRLGLDRPLLEQYGDWLGDVLSGDLGLSYAGARPVTELVVQRVPPTVSLMLTALAVSLLVSLPAGLAAARWPSGWVDSTVKVISAFGIAVPNFFLGLVLILVFAVKLGWLPAGGYRDFGASPAEWLRRLILPAITLGTALAAEQARTLRASMKSEMGSDYVRTARAKRVSNLSIAVKHAGRNASLPLVTVVGLQVGRVLAGTVFVETVFSIPGLGSLAAQSVISRDLPTVQALVILTSVVVLTASLVVDVAYERLNPVLRKG